MAIPSLPALAATLLALSLSWPLLAAEPAKRLAGNPAAGQQKADDERCQECHGHDGNADDIEDGIGNVGKFPRLAGQHPDYIFKQIRDFRSGARNNETMLVMARAVSDADLADIAAYFASQPRRKAPPVAVGPATVRLFAEGDAARGVPACAGCHGADGRGQAATPPGAPAVAGQHRRYLLKQLLEWRAGERRNSAGGVMNQVVKPLADHELEALADYMAGL